MSEVKTGTSKSGYEWRNMELTIDVPGYQGAVTKQVFRVSGDSVDYVQKFSIGEKVQVKWTMYAREWNGRMYTNVDLIDITALDDAAPAREEEPVTLEPQSQDLPF